jgi:hypothetical protein
MAQIIVPNLDDSIVERLKARARTNERSLEAEVRLNPGAIGQGGHGSSSPDSNGEA